MQTQLPEKIKGEISHSGTFGQVSTLKGSDGVINQLIDYLAELTTVVEGKVDKPVSWKTVDLRRPTTLTLKEVVDAWKKQALELAEVREVEMSKPTPTLKETLLGEIRNLPAHHNMQGHSHVNLKDVEAIINSIFKE